MTTIHEDYKTICLIGQGSFGKVYKVESKKDGKIYAMKEINYSRMKTKEKELLVSEVNILRKLNHVSIVRYIDRYQDKNLSIIYIVMEYCGYGDLSKVIKQRKQQQKYLEEDLVWSIFIEMLLGMDYCHHPPAGAQITSAVINRDIKPANIFMTDLRTIKVGDFGLCRTLGDYSMAKTNVGTPLYMAPELLENKPYNEKVDIWSMGAILYEMCALQPPYVATSMDSLKLKVARGIRPFIPSHYSKEMKETIDMMLVKDFSRRPSTKDIIALPHIERMIEAGNFEEEADNQVFGGNVEANLQLQPSMPMQVQAQLPPEKPIWNKPVTTYIFGFDRLDRNNQFALEQQLKQKEAELDQYEQVINEKELYAKERCGELGINYDWI